MKRAKKSFWFLAGILLLLGFCFREDVLASSLTSLPSLSKAGIGEVVSSDSVIDGRYDFTPLIGSETNGVISVPSRRWSRKKEKCMRNIRMLESATGKI